MSKKHPKRQKSMVYQKTFPITAAVLAYAGRKNSEIQRYFKVADVTFQKWQKKRPFLAFALKEGRALRASQNTDKLDEWIISKLTPQSREVWESLMFWQEHRDAGEKLAGITKPLTLAMKQRIFLYALIRGRFSVSAACSVTGIPRRTVDSWKIQGKFKDLFDEVMTMQNDFIEEALMDLVAMRDTGAVIFASRTKNKERGYGDKLEINQNISGTINVQHAFKLDKLMGMLSVRCRAELVEAMDKVEAEERKLLKAKESPQEEAIEADVTEVEEKESDSDKE